MPIEQFHNPEIEAILRSAVLPDEFQKKRIREFLEKKYNSKVKLICEEDITIQGGFKLRVGTDVYDWTVDGKLDQLKKHLAEIPETTPERLMTLLKDQMSDWHPEMYAQEVGTVLTVGDGIATISGLEHAVYGEILVFQDGTRGMVQDLKPGEVGCILFDDDENIMEGSTVHRTGKEAGIPVGEDYLGRVINPLGAPIDGKGDIRPRGYRLIESPAPGIIDRQPVNEPMETGILTIDSMFPIGRGQRELIIGDRQTGKTAIALDTILNQKDKDVICIYVAIGQKASSVAQLVETLRKHDALKYSIIVNASASASSPIQYIAPYAGTALGEYFMEQGKDVLIVYDDLSKHAIAYRALSLLLERSPGREAYPGDVFYLHSRLLERSAHLSNAKGGGSMTALPIVETQAGDVSAYIPTNIISITDGQIFLESDLFNAGQRPAVNVGLSVSRVGGAAQTKAMKKATGSIRLDLAQYREMAVFTQFSSDLDDNTRKNLIYGQGLMEMLKQKQYHPLAQHQQVIILVSALAHCYVNVPVKKIQECLKGAVEYVESKGSYICQEIKRDGILSDENRKKIPELVNEYVAEALKKWNA